MITDEMVQAAITAIKHAADDNGDELDEEMLDKYAEIGLQAAAPLIAASCARVAENAGQPKIAELIRKGGQAAYG